MKGGRRQVVLISVAGVGVLVAGADYLARSSDASKRSAAQEEVVDTAGVGRPESTDAPAGGSDAADGDGGARVAALDKALAALDRSVNGVKPDELDRLFGLGPADPVRTADGVAGERSPAGRAGAATLPGDGVPAAAASVSSLRLTAVSTSGGGSAVINGAIYLVGEARGGIELLSVTGRTARVDAGGTTVVLVLE